MSTEILWQDRKRWAFGLPWSFTTYMLTDEKLMVRTGLLNIREEEVRLYRVMDLTLRQSLEERIFGLGTIHCCSADRSSPEFDIKRIKNARAVKEQMSQLVEKERMEKRVAGREYMTDMDDDGEGIL